MPLSEELKFIWNVSIVVLVLIILFPIITIYIPKLWGFDTSYIEGEINMLESPIPIAIASSGKKYGRVPIKESGEKLIPPHADKIYAGPSIFYKAINGAIPELL